MKRSNLIFVYIATIVAIVISWSTSLYSQPNPIKIPIVVSDNSPNDSYGRPPLATLYFGFFYGATYCPDNTYFHFSACDSVYETGLPPVPPSGIFDARWISSRDNNCLDQGLINNIHGWNNPTPRDTFRLKIQLGAGGSPVKLTWPDSLSKYFDSIKLRYIDPVLGPIYVNMRTITSLSLSNNVTNAYIFTYSPKGTQTPPSSPIRIYPANGDTGVNTSATLTWSDPNPSNSLGYLVQISNNAEFTQLLTTANVGTPYFTVKRLSLNTTYFWRVKTISFLNSCYQDDPSSFRTTYRNDTIKVSHSGNGSISPDISEFIPGSSQTFTFTPAEGYFVDSVFVDDIYVGNDPTYQFTSISQNHSLHVKFTIYTYTLSTSTSHGTITKSPDQLLYDYGTIVQLTATPDTGYYFINWAGDASGTSSHTSITMTDNKSVQAFIGLLAETKMYRTATMEQWALAQDSKGKFKANKREYDRVYFQFYLIVPNTSIITLDFSGVLSTGTISKGVGNPVVLKSFTKVKKLTELLSVSPGDTVLIDAIGLARKTMRAKYSWGLRGRYYQVPSYLYNELRFPLPNLVNVGEELFAQHAFPNNLVIGIPQGKRGEHSVIHRKYSDVQKSLVKVINKGIILHLNGPRCLDSIGTKPITQQLLSLSPDKQNNKLFAELLALKLNVTSSAAEKFPIGLGELVYEDSSDPSNPFNGLLVRDIVKEADTMLACLPLRAMPGATQADLFDVMHNINHEFSDSTLDTISFISKTQLTGVNYLITATYLHHPDEAVELTRLTDENSFGNTPSYFELQQNYPNPFNPSTTVSFVLGQSSVVSLRIYNTVGQEVAILVNNEEMESGAHEFLFDATGLTSGVYFYRLQAGTFSETKKLILMK